MSVDKIPMPFEKRVVIQMDYARTFRLETKGGSYIEATVPVGAEIVFYNAGDLADFQLTVLETDPLKIV
jgi:hypothetical protein